MEFLEIIKDINITEEQEAALAKFFEVYKNKVHDDAIAKYLEEHKEDEEKNQEVDLDKYILREDADRAFDQFEKDCDKAFELFEEDCNKAFELFEEDCNKAFELFEEDTRKEYTETMAQTMAEVYDEIQQRVQKDFMESAEYKTVDKLKDLIIPLIENTDQQELIKKLKEINEEKEQVEEENKNLAKENAIAKLMKNIPQEYEETVSEFISKGKDEDDVVDRFNTIIEMIETKLSDNKDKGKGKFFKKKTKEEEKEEKKSMNEEVKEDEVKEDAKPIVESVSLVQEFERKKSKVKPFSKGEQDIINAVFGD